MIFFHETSEFVSFCDYMTHLKFWPCQCNFLNFKASNLRVVEEIYLKLKQHCKSTILQ